MFESPHRLQAAVKDLVQVCGPARQLTIARELTKRFEQVTTLAVGETADWLARDAHRSQGEFVLIVHQAPERDSSGGVDESTVRLLDALLETVSVRDAVRIAAKATGLPRDELYALDLERGEARQLEW